jgi:hypothetical protein
MNRWAPWFCALLTACVFFLSATSASAQRQRRGSAQVCVPGAQSACACMGGASGVQRCNASGTALLPCECPDTPAIAPASSPARWGRADDSPTLTRSAEASTPASTFSAASGERRWYGWQILIPDLAGSLLYTTGALIGGAADSHCRSQASPNGSSPGRSCTGRTGTWVADLRACSGFVWDCPSVAR